MKVIRVTNLKDTIEERTFYELGGKFHSLDGKVYRRDTANEGHLEKLALKDVDFFNGEEILTRERLFDWSEKWLREVY